jgi:Spy/CpxP family protein refolding chaperone
MGRISHVALALSFFFVFSIVHASAQSPRMKPPHEMGGRHWRGEGRCPGALELSPSPDQAKALDQLSHGYLQETRRLRMELLSKRLELREFLTDLSVKGEAIHAKTSEIVELQSRLEQTATDYLLKVRNVLTQDQLKNWCPEQDLFMSQRMMERPHSRPHRPAPPNEGTKKE